MKYKLVAIIIFIFLAVFVCACAPGNEKGPVIKKWSAMEYDSHLKEDKEVYYMTIDGILVHETDPIKQPQPKIVTPETNGSAPSDAIVLFDGSKESFENNWTDTKGNPTKWKFANGAMASVGNAGYIQSKQKFGSCQLHIEWATPSKVKGDGQGRGNSGVFLMSTYEIQVLDSYDNTTYPDGQAGAIYGRSKPLVNASRPPGQWQSYDIIFHRPIFDDEGNVTKQATFTILHNGIVIHDNYQVTGRTYWQSPHSVLDYAPHADKLPLQMQDHGNPIRYRNIWVRELED